VVVELSVDKSNSLLHKLARHDIDFAIATIYGGYPGIAVQELASIRYSLVCSPRVARGNKRGALPDIQDLPLLTQSDTFGQPSALMRFLHEGGLRFNRIVTCDSLSTRAKLAAAGFGIACVPAEYFRPDVEAGRLVTIASDPEIPQFRYGAFYRMEDRLGFAPYLAQLARGVCDFSAGR
jgi:DNA-binding transcriptional LysR family regulator